MHSILPGLYQVPKIDEGSIQPLIEKGLYRLAEKVNADTSYLWLLDSKGDKFYCEAQQPNDKNLLSQTLSAHLIPDACLKCVSEGVNINECISKYLNIDDDKHPLCIELGVKCFVSSPIIIHGEIVGFIGLGKRRTAFENIEHIISTLNGLAQFFGRALLAKEYLLKEKQSLSTNHILEEIETIASIGGWEFELATEKLTLTKESIRIYGLEEDIAFTPEVGIKFYSQEVQDVIAKAFECAVNNATPYELELPFIDAKKQKKWVKTTGKPRVSNGIVTHIYGALEDITTHKELLDNQKQTNRNLKIILDNLNDSIVVIGENGIILSTNKVVKKIFGYEQNELVGLNISVLMPEPYASKHGKYMNQYLSTGKAGIIGIGRELPAITKGGQTFPMELAITEVLQGDSKVFIGIIRDITERKKAQAHINKLAYYDGITDAYNRNSFEKDLRESFYSTEFIRNQTSILLFDIDKFTQINLIFGEALGDELLKCVVKRIKEHIPLRATIYRNNADCFYIIIKKHSAMSFDETTVVNSQVIAEELLTVIKQEFLIEQNKVHITSSIGLLELNDPELEFTNIKPLLELAVRNSKIQGGNKVSSAQSTEVAYIKRHSELTIAMKSTHFLDELNLVVQPQYNLSKEIVGSEVLLRWYSPYLGFISPAEFIPLAESNGKIIQIGEWVIEKSCILLSQRRKFSKKHNPISVNVSAKQIAQPNFSEHLITTLKFYEIPYTEIILELTESTLVADFDLVISKMKALKEKGIEFSLDDFGTGYSSLSYIQNLPISELKIDKSFVDEIHSKEKDVPIVNLIIQMGKALNLKVVAEGVETETQLSYLENQGCDVIQGYLFSKPLNTEEWLDVSIKQSK